MEFSSASFKGFLADVVVAVHLAYVSFVLFGLVFVLIGWWRGWQWVRSPIFRFLHLLSIVIVAAEALVGFECPCTTWERNLRLSAGQETSGETFMGRLLHSVLFYDAPEVVFTISYVVFALLVAGSFWLVPLQRKRR